MDAHSTNRLRTLLSKEAGHTSAEGWHDIPDDDAEFTESELVEALAAYGITQATVREWISRSRLSPTAEGRYRLVDAHRVRASTGHFSAALRRASDPAADAYGAQNEPRWPDSQRGWERHLTDATQPLRASLRPTKSKIRAVAKRLHIEAQTLGPREFTLKYGRTLPDLDFEFGPQGDKYLEALGGTINGLTGAETRRPARLFTFPEVGEKLGLDHGDLWRVVRAYDVRPVRVGDGVRLTAAQVDYIRRGLREGH